MSARLLKERTGEDVDVWNRRVKKESFNDKKALRAWLTKQGVTGYAQSLLVMERFGYPDFLLASADELVEGQYGDRPHLRLVSSRRTFARVQPTTKNRVDLGLRLDGQKPGGRLQPSKIHDTMRLQISFTTRDEVDSEALDWLQRAYDRNC
jgi:hypothetical protein